jgi:hypothetical protein
VRGARRRGERVIGIAGLHPAIDAFVGSGDKFSDSEALIFRPKPATMVVTSFNDTYGLKLASHDAKRV